MSNYCTSGTGQPVNTRIINTTITDKIDQWFFKPLEGFHEHESFVILLVILPLYEKYLRAIFPNLKTGGIAKSSPAFVKMGQDFKLSPAEAYNFWQIFRNGICHRAMPKSLGNIKYQLSQDASTAISFDSNRKLFYLNAFKLKDEIKHIIMANGSIFNDNDYPFANEYSVPNS